MLVPLLPLLKSSRLAYVPILLGVWICAACAVPVFAQGGIGGVYSDTWIDTPVTEHDELAPTSPVVVAYSVGQMDPEAFDQTITVHISLVSETGRTVTVDGYGYFSASAIAVLPLAYDEANQGYEIGSYSTVTTYSSSEATTTTTFISVVGVSFSCYELMYVAPPRTAVMRRKVPCNAACGSGGDTLYFRFDPARGWPWNVVVAEPYTKIGSIRICSHVVTTRRVNGPCQCGNVDVPSILPPIIPFPPILNVCSSTFASKCFMYGGDFDFESCTCLGCDSCGGSPILIDINGDGYSLTAAENGVPFDVEASGHKGIWSWTARGSDDAWLVLDRNSNGKIDDGGEMFGNHTRQPDSDEPNGFIALAQFDNVANGGTGDGQIDRQDRVFDSLRLWQDANHDGLSQPEELHPLASLSVESIDLRYKESRRTDRFGNRFKYRAKVHDARHSNVGRWAWDVFLVAAQE